SSVASSTTWCLVDARDRAVARLDGREVEPLALLRVAAVERALREEQRRVEVDEREAAETRGEARRGAHRELRLHHAADHQIEPRGARRERDREGLGDAGFHELHV